ncbi:MAG: hypothetical protein JSU87_10935 [Gemmatimonadota bacterium]|nr:MAG: hypothetical protein JSU87_10935 [Gemmatimonadota bacterium]
MKRLIEVSLWVPVVLLVLVFSEACAPEGDGLESQMTQVPRPDMRQDATISLVREADTVRIAVSPDPLEVRRGDTIFWTPFPGEVALLDWEVYLGPEAPTRDLVVAGNAGEAATSKVRLTAVAKTYKYWVAVRLVLGDSTFLVRIDPQIIVENGD